MNGDANGEVLVGAPGVNSSQGAAYVVFGKDTTTTVDLAIWERSEQRGLPDRPEPPTTTEPGVAVSGIGDMNGDGPADMIVGVPPSTQAADAAPPTSSSGRPRTRHVDLGALGTGGFLIDGAAEQRRLPAKPSRARAT